jgi:hypothetical protein
MICIKFTVHPRSPIVSLQFDTMTSDEVLKASVEHTETSIEQLEESLGGQYVVGSMEASLSHEVASDHESQSGALRRARVALTLLPV